MPDVTVVFSDCTIGREPTGVSDIDKALLAPSVAAEIFSLDLLRGLKIRIEVLQDHEFIIAVQDFFEDHAELFLVFREGSVDKRIHDFFDSRIGVIDIKGVVIAQELELFDFLFLHAEYDNIVISDKVANFNIGTIPVFLR